MSVQIDYKKHILKSWATTWQFEELQNFKVVKPHWKKYFGSEFYLTASKTIAPIEWNIENVIAYKKINWQDDAYLVNNWETLSYWINNTLMYTTDSVWECARMLVMSGWYDWKATTTVTLAEEEDPVKDSNDVFDFSYIKLQLWTTVVPWDYITFTTSNKNLQWITTRIHYVQGWFAYIRWTNLYGTLPEDGDTVHIHTKLWDTVVIADKNKAILLSENTSWIWPIVLYETQDDDEIIDIEKFNWVLFVLTKRYLYFSNSLVNSNANIYPLNFFDNMYNGKTLVAFWKHLIIFWDKNQIISPVNGTKGSLWYVTVDLNYESKLHSKYSVLSYKWSLYVLEEWLRFVKVDIISTSNSEYDVVTTDVMTQTQWMLDDVVWDVFINADEKEINIINPNAWATDMYTYNQVYDMWTTHKFDYNIRYFWKEIYWDFIFNKTEWIPEQKLSFHLWWDNLTNLFTCFYVKFMFVTDNMELPDYNLQIDRYIWWLKLTTNTSIKDLPINDYLTATENLTGYEQFWEWQLSVEDEPDFWHLVTASVTVNQTWDLFVFTLTNKENTITYAGSIIWYKELHPEVNPHNTVLLTTNNTQWVL